jgi:hypothetical protein
MIPARAWQKHSAGPGAHGPRVYSWAWIGLLGRVSRMGCAHAGMDNGAGQ